MWGSRCAGWRAGWTSALLAAGLFLAPAGLQAQSYDQNRDGDLESYLQRRTVFIKMSCTPRIVDADEAVDHGQVVVQPRISWGSGVLIRKDGYLVTAYHTLKGLLQRQKLTTQSKLPYTLACDADDIKIEFFQTDNLVAAARGGLESFPEIRPSRQDSLGQLEDVLFLQANTFGANNLPYVCSYGTYQNDKTFDDRAITAAGIAIQDDGSFSWRKRSGKASSEHGIGNGSNFLVMGVPVEPGMSGGPVADDRGELVGIVHGYRPSSNPAATDNLLIPFYLFGDIFRRLAATCTPPDGDNGEPGGEEPRAENVVDRRYKCATGETLKVCLGQHLKVLDSSKSWEKLRFATEFGSEDVRYYGMQAGDFLPNTWDPCLSSDDDIIFLFDENGILIRYSLRFVHYNNECEQDPVPLTYFAETGKPPGQSTPGTQESVIESRQEGSFFEAQGSAVYIMGWRNDKLTVVDIASRDSPALASLWAADAKDNWIGFIKARLIPKQVSSTIGTWLRGLSITVSPFLD